MFDAALIGELGRAAGQLLKKGGMKVVFCDTCKQAYSQGEECPNCGGPLREIAGVREGEKRLGEPFTPPVPIELDKGPAAPAPIETRQSKGISGGGQGGEPWAITLNGKTQGVAAWSRELGLGTPVIYARLAQGLSAAEVLAPAHPGKVGTDEPIRITLNGETLTAVQWAERTGIKACTILWRYHHGWPPERILNFRKPTEGASENPDSKHRRGPKGRVIEFNGESGDIWHWARKTGIRHNTIYLRLKRGWPVARALTEPELMKAGPPQAEFVVTPEHASIPEIAPYAEASVRLRAEGAIAEVPIAPRAAEQLAVEAALTQEQKLNPNESLIDKCKRLVARIDEIDKIIANWQQERQRTIDEFKTAVK